MNGHTDPAAGALKVPGLGGLSGAPKPAQVAALVVPLVVAGALAAYAYWRSKKAGPKSAVAPSAPGSIEGAQVERWQLRRAWQRFVDRLPSGYRRSILNFEHFVVLGPPASGKSRLVNVYSDWRRQSKQLEASQSHDPDLPVYLGTGVVVTELPARFLLDPSKRCQDALKALWAPLYKQRAPTVVLTLDARQLRQSAPDVLKELAESVRAKLNLLASIRGAPIEIRVALTFLDLAFDGYAEFARFCREQRLPTTAPLSFAEGAPPPEAQLEAWLDGLLAHLPRALKTLSSTDYLRVVAFLRRAPELGGPLGAFLESLLVHEPTSPDPTFGGVLMASEPAGVSNPLERAAERGPGPDPRRRHLFGTAIAASAMVAYLIGVYLDQRRHYLAAEGEVASYASSHALDGREQEARAKISRFTKGPQGWTEAHPDYFARPREELRRRFSQAMRERLLIPLLARAADTGKVDGDPRDVPARRALYFLTLIHSDRTDGLGIGREAANLKVWVRMTGLPASLIRDYLDNTDRAWITRVDVQASTRDIEPRFAWLSWVDFLSEVDEAVRRGWKQPGALHALAERARGLEARLPLYEEDVTTRKLLDGLDIAAGLAPTEEEKRLAPAGGAAGPLKAAYGPSFRGFYGYEADYRVRDQTKKLTAVLREVQDAEVANAPVGPLLRGLVAHLHKVGSAVEGESTGEQTRIEMAGKTFAFKTTSWEEMLRGSTGRERVEQFLQATRGSVSIFFDGSEDQGLPSVKWNVANDGTSIFVGRGEIPGRYTRQAYEKHVVGVVRQLEDALEKARVPEEDRVRVRSVVLAQVRQYASEYRGQTAAFVRSFGLRALSPEALRVAVNEMAKTEETSFQDFLVAVADNTRIDDPDPLLAPVRDAMGEFREWRAVVEQGKGKEIGKYRAILGQMLADLGPAPGAASGGEAPQGPPTLERALSPVGRLVLAEVRGEKGSYKQLVDEWLASVSLPDYQRAPFAAPTAELSRLGRRDIEAVVSAAWNTELLPDVRRLATRFPFDPGSPEDASPAELAAVYHPQTGKVFDVFRRYLEPLSDFSDGGPFRPKPAVRARLKLPDQLYELTNMAAALSARLWDQTGKPQPMAIRVATVPFEHGRNPRLAQTLVYLNVGPAPLFNFNQKPAEVVMQLDWTRQYNAQVGIQLTDLDTKDNAFPEPIKAEGSYWAFQRLLTLGAAQPAKEPQGAQLSTWTFKVGRDGGDAMIAQYVVVDDLAAMFALGPFVRTRLASAPGASAR